MEYPDVPSTAETHSKEDATENEKGTESSDQQTASAISQTKYELEVLKERLRQVAQSFQPSIYKRDKSDLQGLVELGIKVADWGQLKKHKGSILRPFSSKKLDLHRSQHAPRNTIPRLSRAMKSKSNGAGRTYTSKFRGVHQTFPTKRWEAQFRRNGKPTSLGCFDQEEEAARAYDKMMLWCEMHNAAGVKGGITNFDPSDYEKDMGWLQQISQDDLIEALRSDGRRQAAHRMMRQKREGQLSGTECDDDYGDNLGTEATSELTKWVKDGTEGL